MWAQFSFYDKDPKTPEACGPNFIFTKALTKSLKFATEYVYIDNYTLCMQTNLWRIWQNRSKFLKKSLDKYGSICPEFGLDITIRL
jgi:hypothetical protein